MSATPTAVAFAQSSSPSPASPVRKDVTDKDQSSLSSSLPSLPDLKDKRAYEHERQRAKKAADLVKMRARKGQAWASPRNTATTTTKTRSLTRDDVDALDGVPVDRADARDSVFQSDGRTEVKLTDLIATTRVKPRKRKDSDYEVIPHIRSVIVLDDVATRDVAIDEPWEHVDREESDSDSSSSSEKAPSYAKILSLSK